MAFDVIGDVHGHAEALEALLLALGYADRGGAWRHADGRHAIFVGDLIDRGPRQCETVSMVRRMRDADAALVVMGNHEFNAIGFATLDPDHPGRHLRPRQGNNIRHHAAFLDAVGGPDTPLYREFIAFFRSMPLWLDKPALRVVHACWSEAAFDAIGAFLDDGGCLTDAGLQSAFAKGSAAFAACEILLKGQEMDLPAGVFYFDAQGSKRRRTRTRWWDPAAVTIRTASVEASIAQQLPDDPLPAEILVPLDDPKPVFFGHYWMEGRPSLLSPTRTCLDFSIAKGGVLCAYRHDGEPILDPSKLVWIG